MTKRLLAALFSLALVKAAYAVPTAGAPSAIQGGGGGGGSASTLVDDLGCLAGQSTRRNGGDTAWECFTAGAAAGDIEAVGPAFGTGPAFTDGVASTGTTMLVWEGTTVDANQLNILAPSANPGSVINITFPSASGTLLTDASTPAVGDISGSFTAGFTAAAAIARDTETCTGGACTVGTDDTVTFTQGTAPTPTAEGRMEWDTDDNKIVAGDGAAQRHFISSAGISGDVTMTTGGVTTIGNVPAGATVAIDGAEVTTGTVGDARVSGAAESDEIDDDLMPFDDADGIFGATAVGPAIEELNDAIAGPNAADGKLHWTQIIGMPAGFADGSDDGSGGGSGDNVEINGVAAVNPDFRNDGDNSFIRCTGVGAPDASCQAAEDVISRVQANSVALGTDTVNNYAAGDAEAGNALSGDSATAFFSAGQIELARGGTGADTSAYSNGLLGLTGGSMTDVDTWAEIMTILGVSNTALDTSGNATFRTITTSDLDGTNFFALDDNTTGTPSCASLGAAGKVTLLDSDATASLSADFCNGTSLFWRFPPTSTTTTQALFATGTAGAPAYRAIADGDIPDTITASNYLLLAGGTLSGEVVVANLGFEFAAGDVHTNCSAFAATGGGIFYDDSEGKLKKCQDNVLSDLDTTSVGAGITTIEENNVTAVSSAVIIDFLGADFDVTDAGAGEGDVAIAAAITRDAEWDSLAEINAATTDADAVFEPASNGLIARTGAGTTAARTITGTAAEITVTNGDGVSGAPTLSIPDHQRTESFDAWSANVDGAQCTLGTSSIQLNGGPRVADLQCADSASGVIDWSYAMPDNWAAGSDSTDDLSVRIYSQWTQATPSGVLGFDIAIQCVGDSDAVNSTFSATGNLDTTYDTQDDMEFATVTLDPGTCAAGDYVTVRATVDATATTAAAPQTNIQILKMRLGWTVEDLDEVD